MSEMGRPNHRPRRRRSWPRRILVAGVVLIVFVLGIAIGQALEDGPPPPSTETYVRTLTAVTDGSTTSTGP